MFERRLTLADILLIAGTRVALGIGVGLLLSERLNSGQRKAAGWSLIAVGAATTIPLVINLMSKQIYFRKDRARAGSITWQAGNKGLIVRGDLHEYKVHPGSANVLMEPGSHYYDCGQSRRERSEMAYETIFATNTASGHSRPLAKSGNVASDKPSLKF
jgi:hypothetical protein